MNKSYFLLLLFCLPIIASGQILNVEDVHAKRDSTQIWAGNLGFDFTLNNRSATPTMPVRFINISSQANLARYGETNAIWLINFLNYSAITGDAFIRTGYSHLRSSWGYKKKLAVEVFAQGQYDRGRGLQSRWLGGGGLRYNLVNGENTELHAGFGAMYEYEHWLAPETDANVFANYLKSTNYLSLNLQLNDQVLFRVTQYYQVGYDYDLSIWRHRLSLDAQLRIALSEHLAFRTSLDASYESAPIVPIMKTVYYINNGILIAF